MARNRNEAAIAVIDALGGNQGVADILNVAASAVSNWRHRGVPWRYRFALVKVLRSRKITVPEGFVQ